MPTPERSVLALLASRCGATAALVLVLAAGCAGVSSPADDAMVRGPLPYHVGIYVDTESLTWSLPERSEDDRAVAYLGDPEGVILGIQEALTVLEPVVSHTSLLSANNRLDALQEAKGMDMLLAVGLEVAPEFREFERPWSWGTLEIFAWLFGGVGSWFVPSHEYRTDAHLTVAGIELHQRKMRRWYEQENASPPEFDWRQSVEVETRSISFHDRSSFTDDFTEYLLTIFVPPTVLARGDPNRKSVSLTDTVNVALRQRLAEVLKERLLFEDWSKAVSVSFVAPDPNEVVSRDAIALDLAIASRENGRLRALEIYRFAPEVDTFQWRARPEDLAYFEDSFRRLEDGEGEPGDYIPFLVPVDVPLAAGANLVKVRVIREDGEQVVRTMVYYR